jgi:hypothetical protein
VFIPAFKASLQSGHFVKVFKEGDFLVGRIINAATELSCIDENERGPWFDGQAHNQLGGFVNLNWFLQQSFLSFANPKNERGPWSDGQAHNQLGGFVNLNWFLQRSFLSFAIPKMEASSSTSTPLIMYRCFKQNSLVGFTHQSYWRYALFLKMVMQWMGDFAAKVLQMHFIAITSM